MRSVKLPYPRSLRMRLMVTYVVALLLTVAAVALAAYTQIAWNEDGVTSRGLSWQAREIAQALKFDVTGKPSVVSEEHNSVWIYTGAPADLKYRVLASSGEVVLASEPHARALVPAGQDFDPERLVFSTQAGELRLDVLTAPLRIGTQTFYIQAARSERINGLAKRAIGEPVLKIALSMLAASLLIFGAAVYFTLKRTLQPLREASEAASRIEPSNLSKRLSTTSLPTEMAPLVEAFNQALDRLEQGFRVQQEFLAGAAHELKTPLALIRGQIEMEGTADRVTLLRDIDMMARQVHQLLHLAEVSERQNYVIESTDLAAVAGEVADYLARLAERRHVLLRVLASPDSVWIDADRSAAFVLLKNLVENAIHHSPAGGTVVLFVDRQGLKVRDYGTGISINDFPHLFERFWRGAGRRDNGAGLGLAICRQIANTHGWDLTACNVAPGAEFSIRFQPAADRPVGG